MVGFGPAGQQQAGAEILVDEESVVGQMPARRTVDFMQEASGTLMACRISGRPAPDIVRPAEAQ